MVDQHITKNKPKHTYISVQQDEMMQKGFKKEEKKHMDTHRLSFTAAYSRGSAHLADVALFTNGLAGTVYKRDSP